MASSGSHDEFKGAVSVGRQPDRQTAGESLRLPLGLRVDVPLPLILALSDR